MTTEPENTPTPEESDDLLARAAAQGPISGIPRHESDEPEPEEPIGINPRDEGDELTAFNIRG